jgi:hypothetical protein
MLILDRLEILPQYRGQQLGLKYMRAAITRFGIVGSPGSPTL